MNIFDYLRENGIEPKEVSSTGEHSSSCPACGGDDRFCSWDDHFFCRQCHPGRGDLIDLIRLVEGVDFKTACQIAGRPLTAGFKREGRSPARQTLKLIAPPPTTWQKVAAKLIDRAHAELLSNKTVLSWLESERFISLDTVKCFRVGWNPANKYEPRRSWGLPEELNDKGKPKTVFIPAGLVIPCHDSKGRLSRIKIRRPEGEPRYILLPGSNTSPAFFGQSAPAHIVVESELDAILLWQEAGSIVTPIATGGVSFRPDQATVEVMAAGNVSLVSLDSDEVGKQATNLLPWKNALANFQPHPIPARYGKDHTDARRSGMNLKAWVMAGLINRRQTNEPSKITRPKATTDLEAQQATENVSDDSESDQHKINASQAEELQSLPLSKIDTTESEVLIIEATRLLGFVGEADRYQLDRALNTLDTCKVGTDDYNFALSVLAAAIEDAAAYLPKSKRRLAA